MKTIPGFCSIVVSEPESEQLNQTFSVLDTSGKHLKDSRTLAQSKHNAAGANSSDSNNNGSTTNESAAPLVVREIQEFPRMLSFCHEHHMHMLGLLCAHHSLSLFSSVLETPTLQIHGEYVNNLYVYPRFVHGHFHSKKTAKNIGVRVFLKEGDTPETKEGFQVNS